MISRTSILSSDHIVVGFMLMVAGVAVKDENKIESKPPWNHHKFKDATLLGSFLSIERVPKRHYEEA